MRVTFIHLSGSRRGRSDTFAGIRSGSARPRTATCVVSIRRRTGTVSPLHCEVRFENCDFILSDTSSAGGTFVNDRMVAEIILQDGDFIELGEEGPKLRFRVRPEDVAACKPFRLIVSDSRAIALAHPTGGRIVKCHGLRQAPCREPGQGIRATPCPP